MKHIKKSKRNPNRCKKIYTFKNGIDAILMKDNLVNSRNNGKEKIKVTYLPPNEKLSCYFHYTKLFYEDNLDIIERESLFDPALFLFSSTLTKEQHNNQKKIDFTKTKVSNIQNCFNILEACRKHNELNKVYFENVIKKIKLPKSYIHYNNGNNNNDHLACFIELENIITFKKWEKEFEFVSTSTDNTKRKKLYSKYLFRKFLDHFFDCITYLEEVYMFYTTISGNLVESFGLSDLVEEPDIARTLLSHCIAFSFH